MDFEEWRDINGWEGLYQVSNFGRVKSCYRLIKNSTGKGFRSVRERILKPSFNKATGYNSVSLQFEGIANTKRVTRLVAIAFIPNPKDLEEVNHINCIKTDDRVTNLEWVTMLQNRSHAIENGLTPRGESHGNSKITEIQALEIKHGHKGLTQIQIANIYGIHKHTVSNIRRGKRWIYLR